MLREYAQSNAGDRYSKLICEDYLLNKYKLEVIDTCKAHYLRQKFIENCLRAYRKVNNECCKDTVGHNKFGWIAHLIVFEKEERLARKPFKKRLERKLQ
jgi:hypothetical protein